MQKRKGRMYVYISPPPNPVDFFMRGGYKCDMEKNVDQASMERNAARGAMRAEREARREAMRVVAEGRGKLARRVSSVLMDDRIFEDWVEEKGGEVGFMRWLCGQVASGVTAKVLCEERKVEGGLLGAFLAEVPGRLEQYGRAQQWAAEGLVDGALEEAWGDGDDVVRSKLRVDTNMRVAGKWNRSKYGEEKQQGVPGVPVINFVMVGAEVMGLPAERDVTPQVESGPESPVIEPVAEQAKVEYL